MKLQQKIESKQVFNVAKKGGNSPVRQHLSKDALQPKLTVGAPSDIYEKEADQLAVRVMRMPSGGCPGCSEEVTVQSKPLQGKRAGKVQRQSLDDEENVLQRSKVRNRTPNITPGVESNINGLKSGGQPLLPATRSFFEPRFGTDFSHVRIHTGDRAAQTAQAIQAKAFTHGNNIFFNKSQYSPGSLEGKALLAHELTHIIQQDNSMTIRRAVQTWAGEYYTTEYEEFPNKRNPRGVKIELHYKPDVPVNATKIGMTQIAKSCIAGSPHYVNPNVEDRSILGNTGEGYHIDRVSGQNNPIYSGCPVLDDDLSLSESTTSSYAELGFHYMENNQLHEQDAILIDIPHFRNNIANNSSQVFETSALALDGTQRGTYYGSVKWGWEKNSSGTFHMIPLQLVSNDTPSEIFNHSVLLWNTSLNPPDKPNNGLPIMPNVSLPITQGASTNAAGVHLVSSPARYEQSLLGYLAKNTRVQITDWGMNRAFNRTENEYRFWKVTVINGNHAGKVGWVMQKYLSL